MKYRIRMEEFVGSKDFVQGYGMMWDTVALDLAEGEQVVQVEAAYVEGKGFNTLRSATRVWVMSPEAIEARSTEPVEA